MSQVQVSINAITQGYLLAQAVLAGSESVKDLAEKLKADVERLSGEVSEHGGIVQAARKQHCTEDLEIDDYPILSVADEGIWVNAWVWMPNPVAAEDE